MWERAQGPFGKKAAEARLTAPHAGPFPRCLIFAPRASSEKVQSCPFGDEKWAFGNVSLPRVIELVDKSLDLDVASHILSCRPSSL